MTPTALTQNLTEDAIPLPLREPFAAYLEQGCFEAIEVFPDAALVGMTAAEFRALCCDEVDEGDTSEMEVMEVR